MIIQNERFILSFLSILLIFSLCACGMNNGNNIHTREGTSKVDIINSTDTDSGALKPEESTNLNNNELDVKIGSTILTATLSDNSSAKAFAELLRQGTITVNMHDYNSFEKVGDLPQSIVTNDEKITTEPGDIILYKGNQITIYYDTNTYCFTHLGKIIDVSQAELKNLLGTGDVSVTFSLHQEKTAKKVLVAYFSATGTTETIAGYINDTVSGVLYEIIPSVPYTSADLNYSDSDSRTSSEQNDKNARPAISGTVTGMDEYDIIFLGYPIWHGQAPRIISTFLESYDFSSKTIIPFCTSASSGIGSSDTELHSFTESATWEDGKRFSGNEDKSSVADWAKSFIEEMAINQFDFEKRTVLLNSGYEMPIMGLGTYSLTDEECYNSVTALLGNGGRLIDTAYMYHNEAAVGRAVRDSTVPREEIFVTTKIYPNQFENAAGAIEEALEKTGLDYIDLMLLHHPGTGDVEAYKALEQAVSDGKIRSIGLSNWYVEELKDFLPQVSITPAVVQNEIHPYYQENDVIPYIQSLGIVVEGWYPFGGRGYTGKMLGNETISAIGKVHGVTSAQVILRWNLQKGVVVIPGSSNPEHIKENLDIFSFSLNEEEMESINGLDRKEKHDWY